MPDHGPALLPALEANPTRADTWQPDPGTELEDGRALHDYLFVGGDLGRLRTFVTASTKFVVAGALEAVEARLARARDGDVIRVLDYGAGTGLASIEFLKACRERAIDEQLERRGTSLEVHLADFPTTWFAQGFAVLSDCRWTRFHSLLGADGRIRPLLDVTGGRMMDAVMVANVLHLIPPRALARASAELASVTNPGGRLTWCSPDLAPAGPSSVLLHDPNRALRRRWVDVLTDEPRRRSSENGDPSSWLPQVVLEAAGQARESLDPTARLDAQRRADSHILAEPNDAEAVCAVLRAHFDGHVERPTGEVLEEDILAALLVPSNQAEYLAEIRDRRLREGVIREMMSEHVLPEMEERGARGALGLNVQWSLGSFVRKG